MIYLFIVFKAFLVNIYELFSALNRSVSNIESEIYSPNMISSNWAGTNLFKLHHESTQT